MTIALTEPVQDNTLQLDIHISTTLGISASEAKRKLTRYLMDNVSMFLTPQRPLLIVTDANVITWRFAILFAMGPQGILGQVGEIDVDAHNGEILLNSALQKEIEANAKRLAGSAALPTNG